MSRYSPSRRDLNRIRAEADAFSATNPLDVHSASALARARTELRRALKAGLTPDTPERRAEYATAIYRLSQELGRRWAAR